MFNKHTKELIHLYAYIEQLKEDIKHYQFEFNSLKERYSNYEQNCQLKNEEFKKRVRTLLETMSDDALNDIVKIPYGFDEKEKQWAVYTSICSVGGCEFNPLFYTTKRALLEDIAFQTLQGLKIESGYACPECYSEYIKTCI